MTVRVYYRSKPGLWELYRGYVTVNATDFDEALDKAYGKLYQTYKRSRDGWILERMEV